MADRLSLQVVLAAVDKVTGPLKNIVNGAKSAEAALKAAENGLANMTGMKRGINDFQELRATLRKTSRELEETRTKIASHPAAMEQLRAGHDQLAGKVKASRAAMKAYDRALANAKEPSATLTAEYTKQKNELAALETEYKRSTRELRKNERGLKDAEKHVKTLTEREKEQTARLEEKRRALAKAGVSTEQMASRQRALRGEIKQATASVQQQTAQVERLAAMQAKHDAIRASASKWHGHGMNVMGHGAGMAYLGQRALRGAAAPLGDAMAFESSMADVKKVVDFDTPEQFAQMGRDVQDLSMRLPMAATEISTLVAAAGQANIPRQELLRFAEDAAKMGVAFDTSADEAGKTMATWRTAFRLNQQGVVELADKINYLGNTGPANVNQISAVVNRIGALGEVAGLSTGALSALGATVAGMGIQEEVAATGIKNMLLTLSAGSGATKAQRTVFEELGLSAEGMAKAMQDDAAGAIQLVLARLRQLPEAQRAGRLSKLFGRESIGAIAPLLTNMELLEENLRKVGDAEIYAGSMQAEYTARVGTSENALQLLKNTAQALRITIGETLLPEFKRLAERAGVVVTRVVEWMRAHPQLTAAMAKAAIVGAALVTALGGLLTVGGFGMMMFSQFYKYVALLTTGGFGKLLSIGRLLLPVLGGISWPVLAIGAALAAVGVLVWKYWGPISAFFSGLWEQLRGGNGAVLGLMGPLGIVAAVVMKYWQPIKAFMSGLWEGIQLSAGIALDSIMEALAPLMPAWDAISAGIGTAWQWFSKLLAPVQSTGDELQNAANYGRMFGEFLLFSLHLVIGVVGAVVKVFVWLGTTIGNTIGFIVTGMGNLWDVIAGMFTGDWSRVFSALRSHIANIETFFGSLGPKFIQFGVDAIQGFVTGMLSRIPVVGGTLSQVAETGIGLFKKKLDINSPSRVFARFGDSTMQGYALGLNREGDAPVQAITGMGQRVRQAGAGIMLASTLPFTVQAAPAVPLPALDPASAPQASPLPRIAAAPAIVALPPAPVVVLPAQDPASAPQASLLPRIAAMPPIVVQPPMRAQPASATSSGGRATPQPAASPHYEIHIHGAGMDAQAIARAVATELDRRDRQQHAAHRSRLTDID